MIKIHHLLGLLAAASLLGGCASLGGGNGSFACPHPQGVTCMSASDVYHATNHADHVDGVSPSEARRDAREGRSTGKVASPPPATVIDAPMPGRSTVVIAPPSPHVGLSIDGDTLAIAGLTPKARSEGSVLGSAPYRVPAKVMRIYVHPWEDQHGDLHMGSYMFAEIKQRTWSVAEAVKTDPGVFHLLSPSASQDPTKPSTPSTKDQ